MKCGLGITAWIGLVCGPIVMAIGLFLRKRSATNAARYLSLFWILMIIFGFATLMTDPSAKLGFNDSLYLALVISYNLWTWWYLSRARLQESLHQESVHLDLHSS
jgi:hypothetical protein